MLVVITEAFNLSAMTATCSISAQSDWLKKSDVLLGVVLHDGHKVVQGDFLRLVHLCLRHERKQVAVHTKGKSGGERGGKLREGFGVTSQMP